MNLKLLSDAEEIDLDRHGVIQAHAGTGKTYTIENLVVRLVSNPQENSRVHLREILLVTYTEKAAGELKTRIRLGIQKKLQAKEVLENEKLKDHLQDCLATMHEALIGTIHGVCLRLLQSWPFETGIPFQMQSADDSDGLNSMMRTVLRQDWQNPQTAMPQILERLTNKGGKITSADLQAVQEIAEKILDETHSVLDYTHVGNVGCKKFLEIINSYTPKILEDDLGGLLAEYAEIVKNLEKNPGLKKGCRNKAKLQIRAAEIAEVKDFSIVDMEFVEGLESWGTKTKISEQVDNPECAPLLRLVEIRMALAEHPFVRLQGKEKIVLLQDMAKRLRDLWVEHKQINGLLSFQDMLGYTCNAVLNNGEFRKAIQQRLRYGIIDEFQDTSVLQWKIFAGLFLEKNSGSRRLYIVGDPKQSIYSFQGANVGTYISAREEIISRGGALYGLVNNFRSTDELISDYNALLGSEILQSDWFIMENLTYPESGPGGVMASAPIRKKQMLHPLTKYPLQVMEISGDNKKQLYCMAQQAANVICTWVGRRVSLPDSNVFKERELTHGDFAVVVKTHKQAEPFLRVFAEKKIPVAKYKRTGVFMSAMAEDVRTLLHALVVDSTDYSARNSALLTHFFNYHPSGLANCIESASPEMERVLDLFFQWKKHIQEKRWGILFAQIFRQTKIAERLILLGDGEAKLTDLRQIMDYCMERLVRDNMSLSDLVEHLSALQKNGAKAEGEDSDLHSLASDNACVKILTMHGSKGLQFPVVFAVPGKQFIPKNGGISWIEQNKRMVRYTKGSPPIQMVTQVEQEFRRLLYVAFTRPQIALFIPLFRNAKGEIDDVLAQRLHALLHKNKLHLFNNYDFVNVNDIPENYSQTAVEEATESFAKADKYGQELAQKLRVLKINSRRTTQVSYSELSRQMPRERSSEPAEENNPDVKKEIVRCTSVLAPGAYTGNALHKILEQAVGSDLNWVAPQVKNTPPWLLTAIAREFPDANSEAQNLALQLVQRALNDALDLSAMYPNLHVRMADLPMQQRRAELEFQVWQSFSWINGFMDVVFRIPNSAGGVHPWRYFVLDWKSNLLDNYQETFIAASIQAEQYDLQASLYCHALHCWLKSMLKDSYYEQEHLGGAVFVYLRAYTNDFHSKPWCYKASPQKDAAFVEEQLQIKNKALGRGL